MSILRTSDVRLDIGCPSLIIEYPPSPSNAYECTLLGFGWIICLYPLISFADKQIKIPPSALPGAGLLFR